MRLIDADAFDKVLKDAQTECKKNGGNFLFGVLNNVRANLAKAPTVGGWISVKDRPPESGEPVLVTCEIHSLYGNKMRYVCEAFRAEKYSVREGKYPEYTDCYDYCEEDDEYYLKEGWYEIVHNWNEYSSIVIDDFVTHWMPRPEPAKEDV